MRAVNKNKTQFFVTDFKEGSNNDRFWDSVERGEWEPKTYEVFDRFVGPESVVFDIGAWIGPTALYLARIADQVYAFEPDPVAFHQLRKNKEANHMPNLEIQNIALAEKDGILEMGMKTGYGDSMTSMLWKDNIIDAKCENIDEWAWDKLPTFIKMDIEGGEFHLLRHLYKYVMGAISKPTLFVSLHTGWFPKSQEYIDALMPVLSQYQYLYNEKIEEIKYEDILLMGPFPTIIATDYEQQK
jgi:FkbM family methyltransferase